MQRILIITTAVIVLAGSGVVHGVWTDRWTAQPDLADAAAKLERLPLTIGAWHGSAIDMEKDPKSSLAGVIARRYVHATTGKSVTILLGCGRAGPVCTHTPDVCYAGSGYEVEKPKRFTLSGTNGSPEFWTARFVRERATGKSNLRIFWSWHGADSWQVAEYPRAHFAGQKVLHKLYVMREMLQTDEPLETDACVEFMRELLPVIRQSVH